MAKKKTAHQEALSAPRGVKTLAEAKAWMAARGITEIECTVLILPASHAEDHAGVEILLVPGHEPSAVHLLPDHFRRVPGL